MAVLAVRLRERGEGCGDPSRDDEEGGVTLREDEEERPEGVRGVASMYSGRVVPNVIANVLTAMNTVATSKDAERTVQCQGCRPV